MSDFMDRVMRQAEADTSKALRQLAAATESPAWEQRCRELHDAISSFVAHWNRLDKEYSAPEQAASWRDLKALVSTGRNASGGLK